MKTACVCYETVILFFAVKIYKIRLSCGRAQKSSGFRHPFVRYVDISPDRGITRPYNWKFYLFSSAAAARKFASFVSTI